MPGTGGGGGRFDQPTVSVSPQQCWRGEREMNQWGENKDPQGASGLWVAVVVIAVSLVLGTALGFASEDIRKWFVAILFALAAPVAGIKFATAGILRFRVRQYLLAGLSGLLAMMFALMTLLAWSRLAGLF